MKVDIISLGCSKNLVDSERLTKRLENLGHKVFLSPKILPARLSSSILADLSVMPKKNPLTLFLKPYS